jgi:Ca2+-binding EF-hand superfamily protein
LPERFKDAMREASADPHLDLVSSLTAQDTTGEGKVEPSDLVSLLSSTPLFSSAFSPDELQQISLMFDVDSSGAVDLAEW